MSSRFLDLARRRVLILDGAMGTSIFNKNLSVEHDYCGCENCTDILVRTRPDVIQEIHESFLLAGADCVETDSFGANKLVLAEFDLTPETRSLNKMAAEVARAACDKHSTQDKPRFVLGSMGPGTRLITLGNTSWADMLDSYAEQARGLLDGGVDAFIIETCQDLLQVKCAVNAILLALSERGKTALDVPIMVSVTIETTGTMLLGTSIEGAAAALKRYPIMSLGLNCATGPAEMADHVGYLGKHWGASATSGGLGAPLVSVVPNAGLPVLINGRTEYPLAPQPFVEAMLKFVEAHGASLVGGCCGTTPEHIKLLNDAVGGRDILPAGAAARSSRSILLPAKVEPDPAITSLYGATPYRQDNSILIIGERCNASGSKKFKQLLEAEDWDGIVSLAREQVRHDSAHVLDVNVDYAGRDNARDMAEVVKRVVRQVDVPLMLDSTQTKTLEAGLKHAPGACIINSANFEEGDHKFDEICHLAKTYGAGLVIGSIDEDKEASMARTADRKLAIAQRGFDRATKVHGLAPADVMFDPLVLPISTGMASDRRSGLETIEGVRAITKALPQCQTTVGLSNVSFGLKPQARIVLNSAFLHELQEAGLTSAILHFSKILPKNKIPTEQWDAAMDLIYDRRDTAAGGTGLPIGVTDPKFDPLARFVDLFKDAEAAGAAKKEKKLLTLEERLAAHIVDGEKEGLVSTLEEARTKYSPLEIINDHLLAGMKTVGDLFGSGQMQLPFVLQSAEVMKMAVAHLQQYMEKVAGQSKGSIVLATVKGDVHDIGKNLVDIILSNNGYTVHNIGIKQPISDIIKAWRETKADAVGMSGLLVKSVTVMEENLHELNTLGIDVPILLGGAALTRHYCEGHLRGIYKGQVFYGKDAFEGLRTMDMLKADKTSDLISEINERLGKRTAAEEVIARSKADSAKKIEAFEQAKALSASGAATSVAVIERSDVRTDVVVPAPPFWGSRVVKDIDLDLVYPFINTVALYRGQWQFKQGALSDEDFEHQIQDTVGPIFTRLKAQCKAEAVLQPAVVYGYFPCNSDGNDLIIWDPQDFTPGALALKPGVRTPREIERFVFPRQATRKRLCISDYFKPAPSSGGTGEFDVLPMHCVTVGKSATAAAHKLYQANAYSEYLYMHGIGVETAEALAELWHKRIRQELGIANDDSPRIRDLFTQKYRGSRYSFGYPACPDMSDQDKLFRLLDPARIDCTLTDNWQIDPEQSTSAIVVHHPEAKYFNV
ncbi:MAG: methionine synthase [Phycisphaerales bacterium]|jgi:5-methyltetrahydrofolate--homocysteine methyltransferase|nr:methionine synthase [Phycisphaerales bacterium]